ncbi:MAG: tetratricopeptide repeat protein [Cyanobacteria bacterium REEB67]|nr:tetratricopeptide repeat protein [Cyanobacteria bacterium REEB67]
MSEMSVRPVFKKVSSRHVYAPANSTGASAAAYQNRPLQSALRRAEEAGSIAVVAPMAPPPVTMFNTPTAFDATRAFLAQSQTAELPLNRGDEMTRALNAAAAYSQEGTAYLTQGKFDEAERLFILALNITESYDSKDNSVLARALERLASFYLTRASYRQAGPLLKRLYEIRLVQHLHGLRTGNGNSTTGFQARENYLLMALTVEKCSSCLEKLNLLSESEVIYLTLLKRQEEHFGEEHSFTIDALERLGNFYLRARVYGLAQVVFEKLYDVKARVHGAYSMEVSTILSSLALIYSNLELFFDQVAVLERQVFLLDTVHGGTGLSLASALTRLADALSRAAHDHESGTKKDKELIERAELIYRRALTIFEKHYGPSTPTVVGLRARLKTLSEESARHLPIEKVS